MADLSQRFEAESERNTVGSAIIATSPVVVGAARAVNWLLRRENIPRFYTCVWDAREQLRNELGAVGVRVPRSFDQTLSDIDEAGGGLEWLTGQNLLATGSTPQAPIDQRPG